TGGRTALRGGTVRLAASRGARPAGARRGHAVRRPSADSHLTRTVPHWTKGLPMTHHWHSNKASARPTEAPVPTYQYACTSCGHQLEAVQSFSDDPLTVCPACEGKLRKLFSSVGIVFKGSGFYRTDSRSGNGAKSEASSTSTESST